MIRVTPSLAIADDLVEEAFVRAGGPGGQNVNKVATAVQLRFHLARAAGLSEAFRARLTRLAGRRLSKEGVLLITAQRHRTQEANRRDAYERLLELLRRAATAPEPRIPTRLGAAPRRRRREAKTARSGTKQLRRKPGLD
jgi:ribosome-associated protein